VSDKGLSLYPNLFAPGLLAKQVAARMIAKDGMRFICFITVPTIHLYASSVFDEVVLGPRRLNSRDVKYDVLAVRSLDHSHQLFGRPVFESSQVGTLSNLAGRANTQGPGLTGLLEHIT